MAKNYDPSNLPNSHAALQKERKMTRQQMADAVGVSSSTIVRLEQRGLIQYAGKSKRGWFLFDESQIEEVKSRLQMRIPKERDSSSPAASLRNSSTTNFDADVAARVFKELEKRKHPVDIVMELDIHPDVVKSIFLSWKDLRGGLYIPQPVMDKINALPLEGSWPSKTAEELLENLRASAAATLPQCLRCKKEDRVLCKGCAETLYRR